MVRTVANTRQMLRLIRLTDQRSHPHRDVVAVTASSAALAVTARGRCAAAASRAATSRDPSRRAAAARSLSCPPGVAAALATDRSRRVRLSTPRRLRLEAMSYEPDTALRHAAAGAETTRSVLTRCLADSDVAVHAAAVGNAAMPAAILEALTHPPKDQYLVAANTALTPRCCRLITNDGDVVVLGILAENLSCPPDVLARLLEHRHTHVSNNAASNRHCPVDLTKKAALDRLQISPEALSNPVLPASLIDDLSHSKETWVRSIVAEHPNCSPETLLRLSADTEDMVRSSAAANPNTPHDVIVRTATTTDKHYLPRIAANPSCPAEVLRRVCAAGDSPERDIAAAHPNTPSDVIESMCNNRDYRARAAAAANPTLTLETLACLGDDAATQVRTAAAANLARAGNVRHPPPTNTDH